MSSGLIVIKVVLEKLEITKTFQVSVLDYNNSMMVSQQISNSFII